MRQKRKQEEKKERMGREGKETDRERDRQRQRQTRDRQIERQKENIEKIWGYFGNPSHSLFIRLCTFHTKSQVFFDRTFIQKDCCLWFLILFKNLKKVYKSKVSQELRTRGHIKNKDSNLLKGKQFRIFQNPYGYRVFGENINMV